MTNWDDTIVAIATPPGLGAIAVLRISGKSALTIADQLFPSKNLLQQPAPSLHVGMLVSNGEPIDEVVLTLFKGPKSYTGEDVIEISCHGSPFIQQQILNACINHGARLAKAGEYTQRAFLNGKLDLAQAEAVADLIASETAAAKNTALNAMRGGFSLILKELRDQMIKFSALIELELDFSQEDVAFADRSQFYELVSGAKVTTQQLIDSFQYGNVIKNGVQVAIVGKPNAGKSTLLNAFLNENRAIVSEIAGTTRDTIEEILNIDGLLFRLIDTAGIREHTTDVIEQAGMARSYEKIDQADLVMYVFDVNEITAEELQDILAEYKARELNFIPVGNKADLLGVEFAKAKFSSFEEIVYISAKSLENIEELKSVMVNLVMQGRVNVDDTIVTNTRHYDALRSVEISLEEIIAGLDSGLVSDLLALDIRRCLHYLGEITGEITNDEQLDWIFSKFCIGK